MDGIFFDSTSKQTLLYNNGGISMSIDTNGNVGINDTSPSYKLEVNGTLGVTGAATFSSSLTAANLRIGNGSVSTPSYSFTNSTNTGFYLTDDGFGPYVNLAMSGSNAVTIKYNGNVGIGTTAPASKLHVNLTTNENVSLGSLSSIPTGRTLIIQTSANGGSIETYSSITGGYVNTLINPNGGKVGIGTSSPTEKLQVVGSLQWGSATNYINTSNDSTGIYMEVVGTTNSTRRLRIQGINDAGNRYTAIKINAGSEVIAFETADTERMRITSGGFTKASNTSSYYNAGASFHELCSNVVNSSSLVVNNSSASGPYGITVIHSGASPNNTADFFMECVDTTTARFQLRSNGGLANFQANNVNLSDERTKKDIIALESYWDKFKAIEIVKFKYKDQTHDDFNIGVIAQQVEKVAPEFIDIEGWDTKPKFDEEGNEIINEEEPLMSVYTADLYHATIKVLQEAMAKIEKLEAEIDELKAKIK
jgi:hypothetical protein